MTEDKRKPMTPKDTLTYLQPSSSTNWKERVGAELARQRAAEEARPEQERLEKEREEQVRIQREQELMERLAKFDSLGISQKLTDINRDILKGMGELNTFRREITSEGLATAGVSLSIVVPSVFEKQESIYKRVFGRYLHELWGGGVSGENSGSGTPYFVGRFGWHSEIVGYKTTGYRYQSPRVKNNLLIGYRSGVSSGVAQIGITDSLVKIDPGCNLRDDWRIMRGDIMPKIQYSDWGHQLIKIFPDSSEPYAKGIVLTAPAVDFENGLVSNL